MLNFSKCPVCGQAVNGVDRFCDKHKDDFIQGKIYACKKCGKWHYKEVNCEDVNEPYFELPAYGFEKCLICGAKTDGYAFCKRCYKKHSEEELLDILNKSFIKEELCEEEIKKEQQNTNLTREEQDIVVIVDNDNLSRCLICGEQTNGLLFCAGCYHKYKNKELLFRVTNCSRVELVSSSYESKYITKDGHIVKSKSEREIDNYLFEHSIQHIYEPELAYGASEKEVIHPDFLLPNYLGEGNDVYLEHWGYSEDNLQYADTKNFKMPLYKDLGITLISTYEVTDAKKIYSVLDRKLKKAFIKLNEIN